MFTGGPVEWWLLQSAAWLWSPPPPGWASPTWPCCWLLPGLQLAPASPCSAELRVGFRWRLYPRDICLLIAKTWKEIKFFVLFCKYCYWSETHRQQNAKVLGTHLELVECSHNLDQDQYVSSSPCHTWVTVSSKVTAIPISMTTG